MLLRASFSAPRVQHLLRCSPSVDHPALLSFDNLLRSALILITNCDLSDRQWLQASLPIRHGGIGLRRVTSLALPAFLSSAVSTSPTQDTILSAFPCSADSYFESYLTDWQSKFGISFESRDLPAKQCFWDGPGIKANYSELVSGANDPASQARLLAASAPHSGDWLLALPITTCGLRLEDEAIRVAVSLRLGLRICEPHRCRCGASVDSWGLHSFVCKQAPGRTIRHHNLNDIISRAFSSAQIPVTKEPTALSRNDGKRPDGLTLIPWQKGKPLTWDVTVISTLADSYLAAGSRGPGEVAELAASRKEEKYSCLSASYLFQPIALENLGPLNSSAHDFVKELGRRISLVSGDSRETSFLYQRLSVSLQRFNSVLVSETFVASDAPDG